MIQIWIESKDNYLSALSNGVEESSNKTAVLLLPGFYQAKCDSYYFISQFLKRLNKNNIYGICVDLPGSGDSYGNIKNCSMNLIIDAINGVIKYLKCQGFEKIYAVARGMAGNILQYYFVYDIIFIQEILYLLTSRKEIVYE